MSDVITEYLYDEPEDRLVIKRTQDVEPYLDANKAAFNESPEHGRWKGDFHHAARIPNVIVEQWLKEGINVFRKEDWPKVRAKLNSNEFRYLRTKPGRI